ncbi:MAG: Signal recognition particle receptor FtsY [Chlamydiae bacterium]|nr:Signal recognition particle receptor FtsY [Chlamydiota bacterium]
MVFKFLKSGYDKVKTALSRTSSKLTHRIKNLFQNKIDPETIDGLEQVLYEADLGVQTAQQLTESLQEKFRQNPSMTPDDLIEYLKEQLLKILEETPAPDLREPQSSEPLVILIVGVNGNGKTTSVAKIAKRLKDSGKKVLVAATDTFRAAGIEQLVTWAQRLDVDVVKGLPKSDPAAVAFDALSAAKARNADVILIDTAGRLHTKIPLMQELEKIKRTCNKVIDGSPHETWLVLDATTGQNAIDQAKIFNQFTPLTGLILTKLDGSAKGGIVFKIHQELKIPLRFIGIGEGAEDLLPFDPQSFVSALFE